MDGSWACEGHCAAFELALGVLLVGAGVFLLLTRREADGSGPALTHGRLGPRIPHRRVLEMGVSFAVGFVSSLLGIGGGIIHVPALVHALGFAVHIATAASHFVLAVTAGAGTATRLFTGSFHTGWRRTVALGVWVVIGAQLGARWAERARPVLILRGLAVALLLVEAGILVQAARALAG